MKKLLIFSLSLTLFACGGKKEKEKETTTQTETTTEKATTSESTPLKGVIKEIKKKDHGLSVLVTLECLTDEKTTPNLFYTKLLDEDGLACTVELMESPKPMFDFKDMYKGDKASGWLAFKYPSSNFKPKKIVFTKILSGEKLCEIEIPE
jgi:hypothetical protein